MKVILEKRPKNPTIIEGFPGFGLIGTITTEFLIEHLHAQLIGRVRLEEIPPLIAIHQGKPIEPVGIYYDKRYNLIILHALSATNNLEWDLSDVIIRLAKDLKAKEIISLEGVGSQFELKESRVFYMTNFDKNAKVKKIGLDMLQEGIIVGVTGALLLSQEVPVTCIFAETHSALPDSRAAAKIIEALDKYLGLKVNYQPLLEKAQKFEAKIRDVMTKTQEASAAKDKKSPTYFG